MHIRGEMIFSFIVHTARFILSAIQRSILRILLRKARYLFNFIGSIVSLDRSKMLTLLRQLMNIREELDEDIKNARARDVSIIQSVGNNYQARLAMIIAWTVLIVSVSILILFKDYMYEEDVILIFAIISFCIYIISKFVAFEFGNK